MKMTTIVAGMHDVPGVRCTHLPPAWLLLLALLGILLTCPIAHATEPRQQGSAAWAMVMAKHRLTAVPKSTRKSCPCSSQCVCGCNNGTACQCGATTQRNTTSSGCQMINGVMVCPNK
jgi:hypothetical protein